MKTESRIFWFIAVFFAVMTPIYWFASQEIIGTIALGFTFALGFMIAAFLSHEAKHFDARPEDREDGTVEEAAGNYGFFAPQSTWPFWCAVVVTIILLGLSVEQWWITVLGFGIGIWALTGWVLQFYRGDYQH